MKSLMAVLVLCGIAILCLYGSSMAQPPPPFNYEVCDRLGIQNEEQIFFDPTDSTRLIAVWRDFRLGYRQVGVGSLFLPGVYDLWVDSLIHPTMQYFGSASWQSDPTLTVDADGNFYMSVLDYRNIPNDDSSVISFYKSTDQGLSWSGPVIVPDTLGPWFEDKQFITADRSTSPHRGNVYVAWARFPNPTRMQFARSIDGAATFEDTVSFARPYDLADCGIFGIDAGQFAFPVVDAGGAVYVFWNNIIADDSCNLYRAISMVKSTDGGVSFGPVTPVCRTVGSYSQVDGGVDVYNAPILDADLSGGPFDGYLYLCYANIDTLSPTFDFNIEFRRSTDGGLTWTDEQLINDDNSTQFDQFHPWMVVNQEGLITCIWYDQRRDVVNNTNFDLFAAYSFDGGESWTTNHRISAYWVVPSLLRAIPGDPEPMSATVSPTDITIAPQAGAIAEYIGVTSYRDLHHAVWTGTRHGDQGVFGANWETPFLVPRQIFPLGDTVTTANLIWASAWKTSDDHYDVEVYADPNFTTLVYSNTTDTTFDDATSALTPGTEYYWRVRAWRTPDQAFTDWSTLAPFVLASTGCCVGDRGDMNSDGTDADPIDLAFLVDFLFSGGPAPLCDEEADVNGDSSVADPIDLAFLVDFLFGSGAAPGACP